MRSSPSVPARRPEPRPPSTVRIFQSETAEILETPRPLRSRSAVLLLAGCLASLLTVTLLLRMDRVVTSTEGQIVTTRATIVVQALDPSIIKTIDVQEGERVKKGQLLATLDPTFAVADVNALKLQIDSLNAQIARIKAETAERPFEMPSSPGPGAAQYWEMQKSYYDQRVAQFRAQMHAYNEQIAQIEAAITKYQQDQARYADRAQISEQIENMRATLAKAQVGSKLNLLVATDQRLEILRNLDLDHNQLIEKRHELQSTIAQRNAFAQQRLGDLSKELVQAQNDRDNAREQLAKASLRRDLVRLTAPEDAVVLKLAKLSVGSVLRQGDTLMDLAPLHSPMEAELHIAARDVGFIRVGDPTTIKFSAFDFIAHGAAEGKVRWISRGSFSLDDDGKQVGTYYKARVTLTKVALRDVPKSFTLLPGMTLTGDIHIGTRSVFAYVLGGVMRGANEAMREP